MTEDANEIRRHRHSLHRCEESVEGFDGDYNDDNPVLRHDHFLLSSNEISDNVRVPNCGSCFVETLDNVVFSFGCLVFENRDSMTPLGRTQMKRTPLIKILNSLFFDDGDRLSVPFFFDDPLFDRVCGYLRNRRGFSLFFSVYRYQNAFFCDAVFRLCVYSQEESDPYSVLDIDPSSLHSKCAHSGHFSNVSRCALCFGIDRSPHAWNDDLRVESCSGTFRNGQKSSLYR